MRSMLLTTAAAVAFSTGAFAADLPARAPAIAPAPIFVGINWTGFYVGADAGYAWGRATRNDVNGYNGAFPNISYDTDGWQGNVHLGYNFQSGSFVYGIEAEFGYLDLRGSHQHAPFVGVRLPTDSRSSTRDGAYGAASLRAGFAFDRALIYVRGGVAGADIRQSFIDNDPAGTILVTGTSTSDLRWGWTVGAGLAYALNNNWSARLEYNYYDFGKESHTATNNFGAQFTFRHGLTAHTVRAGLNYRFGGPAGPVVAKY